MVAALQPFARAQKDLQSSAGNGRHGSIWEWLVTFEGLRKHIKKGMVAAEAKYYENHEIVVAYQQCWQKLDKYYIGSDKQHTLYAAATLLVPYAHKAFFDRNWSKAWSKQMIKSVHEHYKTYYSHSNSTN